MTAFICYSGKLHFVTFHQWKAKFPAYRSPSNHQTIRTAVFNTGAGQPLHSPGEKAGKKAALHFLLYKVLNSFNSLNGKSKREIEAGEKHKSGSEWRWCDGRHAETGSWFWGRIIQSPAALLWNIASAALTFIYLITTNLCSSKKEWIANISE